MTLLHRQGTIRRAILLIKEAAGDEAPLERFTFEFEWLVRQRDLPKDGDDFMCVVPLHLHLSYSA